MPIAWRVIAWFLGFVIALASKIYVRSLGFDWLKVVIVLPGTWLLSSSIISQFCAALALRNASKNEPKVPGYIERLEKQTPQILKEYAKLHAKFPRCVIDISWLPADKQRIVEVIKFAWLTAKDDKTRARLEGDWMFLSQFQYGVGATPVLVFSRRSAKISRRPSKEQERWFGMVSTESKFLARECEQFKQTQIQPAL
jgi:hypothetical protein